MPTSAERIQILYEISMSIGVSLDLTKVLRTSLSAILRKLNCSAGGIFILDRKNDGRNEFKQIFSIPRSTDRIQIYQNALGKIPTRLDNQKLASFQEKLPISGKDDFGNYFHILDIPDWGVLILIKSGKDLESITVGSLSSVLSKLAGACFACEQNEEVKDREKELRLITESSLDTIFILTAGGKIIYLSPSAGDLTGYEIDELINTHFTKYFPKKEWVRLTDILKEVIQGKKITNLETILKHRNGHLIPIEISGQLIKKDGKYFAQGTIRDISKRKQAEEELRRSEEKYRTLFEGVEDVVYISTPNGKLIDINEAGVQLFNYSSKDELLQVNIAKDIYFNSQDREKFKSRLERNGSVKSLELKLKRKDGTPIFVTETGFEVRDDENRIVAYYGIIHDITDRKHVESELKLSLNKFRQAMESIVQAMATTTEVRDPYTAGHQRRVSRLATAIAEEMRLPKHIIEGIRLAGMIHDLGKISVPAEILTKPGKLSLLEFEIIKKHIHAGYDILKSVEFLWPIAQIVLQHQERYDGSGYPSGLKKEEILIEARVLGVADVVEAMAFHRPYREALGIEKALNEISDNRGIRYDPKVADACLCLFNEKGFIFEN